jgi:general nucleoside transport system permease protein
VSALAEAPARSRVGAREVSWIALALGVLAAFIALPPILLRTPVPSLVLALAAVAGGVYAVREGEKRLGWIAIVVAVLAAVGAVAATQTNEASLDAVFVWSALFAAMLRFATPLTFAALGGLLCERSGVINIGLEGMMLMGAFFGIFGADLTGSWVLGCVIGMASGGALALIHAVLSVSFRADQVVSGFGLNFLALGITGYVFVAHYGAEGTPGDVPRVPNVSLPGIEDVGFFGEAIGNANLLTWIALLLVVLTAVFLFRTPQGLRLRSVGEKPRASETVGVSVVRTRYIAVITSGFLAALGGAYLSIALLGSFTENMTAGRGYIALAAVIFGAWRPFGALVAALLFGFSSALAQRLPEFSESTAVLFQALPYVLTLIVVAGVVGRSRPPASIGVPYVKE